MDLRVFPGRSDNQKFYVLGYSVMNKNDALVSKDREFFPVPFADAYLFNNPEKIYGDSAQYLNHIQERLINGMRNRLQTSKTKQKELSLVLSSRNEIFINEYNQHIAAYCLSPFQ